MATTHCRLTNNSQGMDKSSSTKEMFPSAHKEAVLL